MGKRRWGLWVATALCGCTPHAADDTAEVAKAAASPAAEVAPSTEAKVEGELAAAQPEPESSRGHEGPTPESESAPPEPKPDDASSEPVAVVATESVRPHVRAWFEDGDADLGCVGFVEARNVPAYDPQSERVIVLERYERKMSPEREATLLWYDANSGKVVREESLLDGGDDGSCKKANRRSRRLSREVSRSLAEGAWESMSAVPIRRIHEDEYSNFREPLPKDATEDDRLSHAAWGKTIMPRGQVHVVERRDGTVVRMPGVKVYERDVAIRPNTLSKLLGHRPSGVVAAIHADCRDEEDCTCNLEESTNVLHWSAATLAAIDANPCKVAEMGEDDFPCVLGSIFDG